MTGPAKQATPVLSPAYAVVAAAGSGTRMGFAAGKQLLVLEGTPVIVRSCLVLEQTPEIDGYLVVASLEKLPEMTRLLRSFPLRRLIGLAAGDATRQDSVANGLASLRQQVNPPADSPVLVHDGARCLATPELVKRVLDAVRSRFAAGAALPVKDTIKRATPEGRVLETPDRQGLWAMQTPQGAAWSLLTQAYDLASRQGFRGTDDLSVLENAGIPVYLVPGDEQNIKLTTPADLAYARWLLAKREA